MFKYIKVNNEFKDRDVEVKVNNKHTVKQEAIWEIPEGEKLNNLDIVIKKNPNSRGFKNTINRILDFDFNKNEEVKVNLITEKSLLNKILTIEKITNAVKKGVKNRNIEILPQIEGNNLVINVKKKKEMTIQDREEMVKRMVNEFGKS